MCMFVGHKPTKGRGHECGGIVFILYTLFSGGGSVGVRGPAGVCSLFPSHKAGSGSAEVRGQPARFHSLFYHVCPRGQTGQKIP